MLKFYKYSYFIKNRYFFLEKDRLYLFLNKYNLTQYLGDINQVYKISFSKLESELLKRECCRYLVF